MNDFYTCLSFTDIMLQDVLVFIIASLVLIKSASSAVKSVTHVAQFFRLTEFVTSLVIVAGISALPETLIGIVSVIEGDPSLGFGTLLGSNVADLTLILGLVALAGKSLKIHSSIVRWDVFFAGLVVLPILLGLDGTVSRLDAIVLLIAGLGFMLILLREKVQFRKPFSDGNHVVKSIVVFLLSMICMLGAAYFVVGSSHALAIGLGVPSIIIGVVLTALGTTLPEFTFSLASIRKGRSDLAVGDLLGVVVVDATIVVALMALISPIVVSVSLLSVIGAFTALAAVFSVLFMRSGGRVTSNEAYLLVFLYVAFLVVQVLVGGYW